jgi:hypothetical protein
MGCRILAQGALEHCRLPSSCDSHFAPCFARRRETVRIVWTFDGEREKREEQRNGSPIVQVSAQSDSPICLAEMVHVSSGGMQRMSARRRLSNDLTTAITIVLFGVSVAGLALGLSRHSDLAFGVGVASFVFAFLLTVKSARNRAIRHA